jgi:hypothetical protein
MQAGIPAHTPTQEEGTNGYKAYNILLVFSTAEWQIDDSETFLLA